MCRASIDPTKPLVRRPMQRPVVVLLRFNETKRNKAGFSRRKRRREKEEEQEEEQEIKEVFFLKKILDRNRRPQTGQSQRHLGWRRHCQM